jgi:bile acid:Na+ symporter, BASS family
MIDWTAVLGSLAIACCALVAWRLNQSLHWKPFAFSCWVVGFVCAALFFPAAFDQWRGVPASKYVPVLIQVIMFGMGTTLSWQDFSRVLIRPKAVVCGMLLQFTMMPLCGWMLTKIFAFPPEVAAGVILIGTCPGGVASNLITFLARGDLALSVTMTACSTMAAPLMTSLLMSLLAGATIEFSFQQMMLEILSIVIAPVVGGLIVNAILQKLKLRGEWMDSLLSTVAMLAICVVIAIIVARSRGSLLTVGPMLFVVAVIHNAFGYTVGYFGARGVGLSESESRTIAIEVGMQNGGMGSALATTVLHSPQAAIAPTIFGAWMSISGSFLASYWRQRIPNDSPNAQNLVVAVASLPKDLASQEAPQGS